MASSNCSPSRRLPCSQMSRKIRLGCLETIAVSASSLLRAVRVSYPSSCRIPATRSRISASSSTIRMSADMSLPVRVLLFRFSRFGVTCGREPHPHPRPPLPRDFLAGVAQLDPAPMILNDAADDGEAESRALLARRNVRLEQPAAILLRQTNAVIDDVDQNVVVFARGKDADRALAELRWRHRGDGLGRILDQIGGRLWDQPPVQTPR